MPMYDFKDLTSGEVYTKMMSIADMEKTLKIKRYNGIWNSNGYWRNWGIGIKESW